MQLDFNIDVSGWETCFSGASRRLGNMTPAYREVGDLLVEMVRENFDTSGGVEPWAALKESTLLARARNPSGKDDISAAGGGAHKTHTKRGKLTKKAQRVMAAAKPLIWSKALYRSIKTVPTSEYVDVGTPMIKGRTLFFGGKGWHGSIVPPRSPFAWREGDPEKISRIFARHIWGGVLQ
jgi:hypothetical protein